MALGIYQAIIIFFCGFILIQPSYPQNYAGYNYGLDYTSHYSTCSGLLIILLTLAIFIDSWNSIIKYLGFFLSIIAIIICFIMDSFLEGFSSQYKMYFFIPQIFSTPNFYVSIIVSTLIAVAPLIVYRYIQYRFNPCDWQLIREKELHDIKTKNVEMEDLHQN